MITRLNVASIYVLDKDEALDFYVNKLGLAQQKHRALHAAPLEVAMRRLSKGGTEAAHEMRLRDMSYSGHRSDIERLGVGAVHRVTGA